MLNTLIKPTLLTSKERQSLKQCIFMQDWEFDKIKNNCIEVQSYSLRWNKYRESWVRATVFGMRAVWTHTNEPCISNFFIRYENRVYQSHDLSTLLNILSLIKNESSIEEYRNRIQQIRIERNRGKRLEAQKNRKKRKLLS